MRRPEDPTRDPASEALDDHADQDHQTDRRRRSNYHPHERQHLARLARARRPDAHAARIPPLTLAPPRTLAANLHRPTTGRPPADHRPTRTGRPRPAALTLFL